MRAIFIAHGSAFKTGSVIEPFAKIHVYNLIARILGLTPAPGDGNDTVINPALMDSSAGGR
jgi:hypothetical protein